MSIIAKQSFFFLNGHEYFTHSNFTLLDLLKYCNYNETLIVIEYNNSICEKKNWNAIYIENNDKVEIITIVGGG